MLSLYDCRNSKRTITSEHGLALNAEKLSYSLSSVKTMDHLIYTLGFIYIIRSSLTFSVGIFTLIIYRVHSCVITASCHVDPDIV